MHKKTAEQIAELERIESEIRAAHGGKVNAGQAYLDLNRAIRLKRGSVLTVFSKGKTGASVALNLATSGGANCAVGCPHHPESTAQNPTFACYAVTVENRPDRKPLLRKLERHELTSAAVLCRQALNELRDLKRRGYTITWFRFSSAGSLPNPADCDRATIGSLRVLLHYCEMESIDVHLPIETARKAAYYRRQLGEYGQFSVRESAVSVRRFLAAPNAVSAVAPIGADRSFRARIKAAVALAKKRRKKTGRTVVVCPAVISGFNRKTKRGRGAKAVKCGQCTACANPLIDIVYPEH